MQLYQRGSTGVEVKRIQTRLKELKLYLGPIDGDFGGGTEIAVREFQKGHGLGPDGKVGPKTWEALFEGEELPAPEIVEKSLAYRCLALTGTFETGAPVPECFAGLSGDFDGQGISFGVLQWNFGQGSLPPLLREMDQKHPQVFSAIFGDHQPVLEAVLKEGKEEQLHWARSIQDSKFRLAEPWRGQFKTLGRRPEFQEIEVAHADRTFQSALALCKSYEIRSERAAALMFDILTQNGGIGSVVKAQILTDFGKIPLSVGEEQREVARLRIVANRRAEAAKPQWIEDVRARKLTIANGEGKVHGRPFDLAGQYGIRLQPFATT